MYDLASPRIKGERYNMAERGVFAAELQLGDRGCHDARSTASILSCINRIKMT
jgi:hypothetical protein